MSKTPRAGLWFAAVATIFFARAMLFSTWLARGPEVRASLHLDTVSMGLLVMLYPAGGLLGIMFASELTRRFGSSLLTKISYTVAGLGFVALGFAVDAGNIWLSAILLLVMGLPMALEDYVANFESAGLNALTKKSLMPALHASFGLGMVLGAWVTSVLIDQKVDMVINGILIAVVVIFPSLWAATVFPDRIGTKLSAAEAKNYSKQARSVWREKRTLLIAFIGFSFIMSEISAGTWVPIALTNNNISQAYAALALSIFWVVITAIRAIGSFAVDLFGRYGVILLSALLNAAGVAVFMLDPILHAPFLGMGLWAAGLALGFPMAITAQADEPTKAPLRVNLMVTMVYLASVAVGPALGSLGQVVGVYSAFSIPLAFLMISALLSRVTKP